ncbi:acyl carrier protein [Amycolatopsis sp. TRM77291]|uniref:acyl carrier protein n=1 Tax=Amycolatopsis sp. WAC 04197 TaxID=2203199 RepID=UPI000F7B7B30|nr:acyl carrier protein [Amycolatopsis sp. WAC 04197]RSN39089.1 actinorhodin polyketide synthase [Amycolatopsis sp. WAC 04197]
MTLEDLKRILIDCAGDDPGGLDGEILDTPFEDLGYDSLALMESAARIKRDFGVDLPEDDVAEVETPRDLLELVGSVGAAAR